MKLKLFVFWIWCFRIFFASALYSEAGSSQETEARDRFKTIGHNVHCLTSTSSATAKAKNLQQCKERCNSNEDCNFVAFWAVKKLCEMCQNCPKTEVVDESEKVSLMQKLSECELELGIDGDGRYLQLISKAFEGNAVRLNPNRNIWCRCISQLIMICGIFVEPNTREDSIVEAKLNRQDMLNMKPFYLLPSIFSDPPSILSDKSSMRVIFDPSSGLGDDRVSAEINVMTMKSCIPISMCLQGNNGPICPVSRKPIRAGDSIYLLSSDFQKALDRKIKSVLCISTPGLRSLAYLGRGYFEDPFRRMKGEKLTITGNYATYFVFGNEQLAKGVCGNRPAEMDDFPRESFMDPEPPAEDASVRQLLRTLTIMHIQDQVSHYQTSFRKRDSAGSIPGGSAPANVPSFEMSPAQSFRPFRKAKMPVATTPLPTSQPTTADMRIPLPEVGTEMTVIGLPNAQGERLMSGRVLHLHPETHMVTLYMNTGQIIMTPPENLITNDILEELQEEMFHVGVGASEIPEDDAQLTYPDIGSQQVIRGLNSRPELNGALGTIVKILPQKKRVSIRIEDGDNKGELVNVRPKNLITQDDLRMFLHTQALDEIIKFRTKRVSTQRNKFTYIWYTFLLFFIFTFFTFLQRLNSRKGSFYIEFQDF